MKMKLALGVIVSLTAITLNRIPTENASENEVLKKEDYTENKLEYVNPDSNSPQDKIYVEGFGYVEDSCPAQGKTVHSDGDINKMVGTMD